MLVSGSGSNYIWSVLDFNLSIWPILGQRGGGGGGPKEQSLSLFIFGWQIVPFFCSKPLNPSFPSFHV